MLQFWCLSPVRVAYHGSFRENLQSVFWGLGLSYHNLMKHMQAFKAEQLKCCSFDASPQSEWLITAHLERIWSQIWGFGVSYRSLIRQMQVFKKGTSEMLQFWCLSPVRVAYHGSFRENLESAFWDFGVSYRSLIRQMQVLQKGHLWNVAVLMPLPSQSGLSRLI